jgi:hypothetical protein
MLADGGQQGTTLAALTTKHSGANGGLNGERLAILGRLVRDHPNDVKMRDLCGDSELPARVRPDRAMRKELQALRRMVPALASLGDRKGYHVATAAGVDEWRRRTRKSRIGR